MRCFLPIGLRLVLPTMPLAAARAVLRRQFGVSGAKTDTGRRVVGGDGRVCTQLCHFWRLADQLLQLVEDYAGLERLSCVGSRRSPTMTANSPTALLRKRPKPAVLEGIR